MSSTQSSSGTLDPPLFDEEDPEGADFSLTEQVVRSGGNDWDPFWGAVRHAFSKFWEADDSTLWKASTVGQAVDIVGKEINGQLPSFLQRYQNSRFLICSQRSEKPWSSFTTHEPWTVEDMQDFLKTLTETDQRALAQWLLAWTT